MRIRLLHVLCAGTLSLLLLPAAQAQTRVVNGGFNHTCVLRGDGTVSCWGQGTASQLGNGANLSSIQPVTVLGVGGVGTLSGITSLGGGDNHTCGADAAGAVYCWGEGTNGKLGNNAAVSSNTPVQVVGVGGTGTLSGITAIAGGISHTCALRSDGTVYCWGQGSSSQLGNGTTTVTQTSPVQVVGVGGAGVLSGITAIGAGDTHTCAVGAAGAVYCWGAGTSGKLGDNTTTSRNTPVQVVGVGASGTLSGIAYVTAGSSHTCAMATGGTAAYCWGLGTGAQLGNNALVSSNSPVQVAGIGGSGTLSGLVSIGSGDNHTCAVITDGSVTCWGTATNGRVGGNTGINASAPTAVVGVGRVGTLSGIRATAGVAAISDGGLHTCAMRTSGAVVCWGNNASGQATNGVANASASPVLVTGLGDATGMIAAGDFHNCVLRPGGAVACWGFGVNGALGNNARGDVTSGSVTVLGVGGSGTLTGITNLAAGNTHTCGVGAGGAVYCWGVQTNGRLGDNVVTATVVLVPVQVLGVGGAGTLSGVTQLALGTTHSCALASGSVYCWGAGANGKLGNNLNADSGTPVQVVGVGGVGTLSGVTAIGAGDLHMCAVLTDASVVCWGEGANGKLGNNAAANSATPVQVVGVGGAGTLGSIQAVAGGTQYSCALTTGGAVFCWGLGTGGQLGNAASLSSTTPVQVVGVGGTGTLSGVSAIAPGGSHVCAVVSGAVDCWGTGTSGQLGNGASVTSNTPVQVVGVGGTGTLSGATSLQSGSQYTCALRSGGTVGCWGFSGNGQLGNGGANSQYTPVDVPGGAALPVELTAFEAVAAGPGLLHLTWTTAAETNNAGFTPQLRREGSLTWTDGGFVTGHGTKAEVSHYQATLAGLAPGRYTLRLAQIDLDGTAHLSPSIEATVGVDAALLTLGPNPVRTIARGLLALPVPGRARVTVYDALGRAVAVLFDGEASGSVPISFDTAGLAGGLYLVQASLPNGQTLTQRLVVTR